MIYDLIVLGGGPAGYNAAERAAHAGLKTLCIEGRSLGGVCLNEGCVPTKTLLYSAKIFDYAKHGEEYGVSFAGASIDHAKVVERKGRVVKMLVGGIQNTLKKAGVEVVNAYGEIMGRDAEGFTVKADGKEYKGAKLLICTGSTAAVPPIPGLREAVASGFAVTNREILDMTKVPEKFVVIGGGVIGLEMASYFNSVGSKVTVIEMLDHIAGPTDREISNILQKNYKKKGVEFLLGCAVKSVGTDSVTYEKDGKEFTVPADCVLVSIGRRAMTQGIGLENIGVITERGAIVTDDQMRTNVAGV
ncbi:MAG: FAD-dependent oxidoreductase, partial [Clostridia bacterium]|nr:FAD-dependent oxidoreductase [Clostridia bacterium]